MTLLRAALAAFALGGCIHQAPAHPLDPLTAEEIDLKLPSQPISNMRAPISILGFGELATGHDDLRLPAKRISR
jgi:hypothetical protein